MRGILPMPKFIGPPKCRNAFYPVLLLYGDSPGASKIWDIWHFMIQFLFLLKKLHVHRMDNNCVKQAFEENKMSSFSHQSQNVINYGLISSSDLTRTILSLSTLNSFSWNGCWQCPKLHGDLSSASQHSSASGSDSPLLWLFHLIKLIFVSLALVYLHQG